MQQFLNKYSSTLLRENDDTKVFLLKAKDSSDIFIMKQVAKYVNDNQILARRLINEAIDKGETNNFIYTYHIFQDTRETIFIQDFVTFTLGDLLNKFSFNDENFVRIIQVVIIRVLLACITMRKKLILHSDLHANNILIGDKPTNNGYFEYKIFNKTVIVPAFFISVQVADFESAQVFTQDNILINNVDFFKAHFSLMYLREKKKFHTKPPNANIFYVDPWFFFKSMMSVLQNHPHKQIELIMNVLLESINVFEEKIGTLFKNKEDSIEEYALHIIDIIHRLNLALETTGIGDKKRQAKFVM